MKLTKNEEHWNAYYRSGKAPIEPSPFAYYVYNEWLKQKCNILRVLDVGCGNGRDTVYFAKNGIISIGIDKSDEAIELAKNYMSFGSYPKTIFTNNDATDLSWCKLSCNVYSRFSLHSMTQKEQEVFLSEANRVVNQDGYLFIEARSNKDKGFETNTDHDRYHINLKHLIDSLNRLKLPILHQEESRGLAPMGTEDPVTIRIVASRTK